MVGIKYENKMWPLIYDHYNHGRHEKEVTFYLRELRQCSGPVLEIACGTGMVFLKLFTEGIDIYGFDISEEMIKVLLAKPEVRRSPEIRPRISRQNMIDFHYNKEFEAIIIPNRSFLHLLTQEDQIACLKNIHAHLQKGGSLILNFFNPSLSHLLKFFNKCSEFESFGTYFHPDTYEQIEVSFKQRNDITEQIQSIIWRFVWGDSIHETEMYLSWIYPQEFQLMLRLAGFTEWTLFGDFNKSTRITEQSELIWVAKKVRN